MSTELAFHRYTVAGTSTELAFRRYGITGLMMTLELDVEPGAVVGVVKPTGITYIAEEP